MKLSTLVFILIILLISIPLMMHYYVSQVRFILSGQHTHVSFVIDVGCLACRYNLTDKLQTKTDTRQLELWSQEDIVIDP